MADSIYNQGKTSIIEEDVDDASVVALLMDDDYSPDVDGDHFISNVQANEISGGGYSRQTLTGVTVTTDDANDKATLDGADVQWSSVTLNNVGGMIVALDLGGGDPSNPLLFFFDFGEAVSVVNGNLDFAFNANGIMDLA